MNETSKKLSDNYPKTLYYACSELSFEILKLRKTKDEGEEGCVYKCKDELLNINFEDIIEYAKEYAEEDAEEFNIENWCGQVSLTQDGAKKIAIHYLNQEIIELENNIAFIKNKIISLS